MKRLAGGDAAEDFDLAHCSEAKIFQRGFAWAGLDQDAAELGEGLDHEHAGHERSIREMTAEEFLISLELPDGIGGGTGHEFGEFVDETKLRTVGQGGKRLN